jgi:hypothetical protein
MFLNFLTFFMFAFNYYLHICDITSHYCTDYKVILGRGTSVGV